MEKEVKAVDKVLNDIQRPFTAIMGGSKVSSKIEIIENLGEQGRQPDYCRRYDLYFHQAAGGKNRVFLSRR